MKTGIGMQEEKSRMSKTAIKWRKLLAHVYASQNDIEHVMSAPRSRVGSGKIANSKHHPGAEGNTSAKVGSAARINPTT